jgi:hypothetical protein
VPGPPICCETITVGQEVKAVFKGAILAYEVTPGSDGVLVATITWDPFWNGSLLNLQIEGTQFTSRPPQWSPVVGEFPVVSGRKYVIAVNPGGTDWFYDDAFVLTTAIR